MYKSTKNQNRQANDRRMSYICHGKKGIKTSENLRDRETNLRDCATKTQVAAQTSKMAEMVVATQTHQMCHLI